VAEGGEKTELPTPKKLRDAREKGQVCISKDVVSTALLVVLMWSLGVIGIVLTDDLSEVLRFIGARIGESGAPATGEAAWMAFVITCKHSFVFVLLAAVVGVAAHVVQFGFIFALESLKPDLNKLNPAEGAKRIFSMKNVFEFLKNCLKVAFLGYLLYKIILDTMPALLEMCYGTISDVIPVLKVILKTMTAYTVFGYVVIAAVDFVFQKKRYMKDMMMTKDEVKREYKEMEGSQEVKQAQRQFRDELLNGPPPKQATRQADVVVTNPTHLAVGIRYRTEESPLPKVVVSGADLIAKIIRDTACAEGIPIVENVPLARALYAKVKVEEYIPVDLVEPVAEVLKVVKALDAADREQRELDEIEL